MRGYVDLDHDHDPDSSSIVDGVFDMILIAYDGIVRGTLECVEY